MLAGQRLAIAKGVLGALFERAYQRRAEVALICFGGGGARLRMPPGRAPGGHNGAIARSLQPIGGGGGTPLNDAVALASTTLRRCQRRHPAQQRVVWLFTDGRTSAMPPRPRHVDALAVVDFESGTLRLGRAARLAAQWQADYCLPEALLDLPRDPGRRF